MDFLIIILIIGGLIAYIIFRRKKVAKLKTEGKEEKTYLGCTLPLIIFIIIFFVFAIFFSIFMQKGYKEAEINSGIKKAQAIYLSNIKNYKNFSNREAKELSIKLFLLDRCEGGQTAIDKMRDFDSNAEIYSCMELLRLNINKENLPADKAELEVLKYLNKINFGNALENYQNFINKTKKLEISTECISGNCKNGFGVKLTKEEGSSDSKYEGEFKDGLFNGKGIFNFDGEYKGDFKNGLFHGKGTYNFDGLKYKGDFKDNLFHGKGVLTYADGHKYSGDFKIGYYHGIGIETFVNGSIYSGGFKKGEPHGEIIQTFADGAKFEGNIDSETGVSKGVYIYADGKIEKGTWENDKLIKSE